MATTLGLEHDKTSHRVDLSTPRLQTDKKVRSFTSALEEYFELLLWSSRYAVLFAVLASVAVAAGMFYVATLDTVVHLKEINSYWKSATSDNHDAVRTQIISHVVEAIDGYLLGTVMLMFGFGLYEIFISRIDRAQKEDRARVLMIHSVDDLKHRLGQVVLLILIVEFFENALKSPFKSLSDLLFLFLPVGILLIAIALHLTHKQNQEH